MQIPITSNKTHLSKNFFLGNRVHCNGLQSLNLAWNPLESQPKDWVNEHSNKIVKEKQKQVLQK